MMQLLTFELTGKFAHFRKYYANNTALSYFVPPRTALMGLIGAIMGYPKDSYYEDMASQHIRIGVQVTQPLKKYIHRVNWLKIEGASDFRGAKQHTQTPFEIISAQAFPVGNVSYRVFLSYYPSGHDTFQRIADTLMAGRQQYAVSLGPANLLGQIQHVQLQKMSSHSEASGFIEVSSAIASSKVKKFDAEKISKYAIEEELFPADFIKNFDREVSKMVRLIYATDGTPLPCQIIGEFYSCENGQGHESFFTFIE